MSMRLSGPRSYIPLVCLTLLAACADDAIQPPGPPAAVIIEHNPGLLDVGDTVRLHARAYDTDGDAVDGSVPLTWRALDTATVRIDTAGLVTGWEGGGARVVATAGAAADTATLLVEVRMKSLAFDVTNNTPNDG